MFKYRRESIRDTFIAVASTFLALIFLVNIGQISALIGLGQIRADKVSQFNLAKTRKNMCSPKLTEKKHILHGPRHAISSEGAKKLKPFLKNVAHYGWATKKILGSRSF